MWLDFTRPSNAWTQIVQSLKVEILTCVRTTTEKKIGEERFMDKMIISCTWINSVKGWWADPARWAICACMRTTHSRYYITPKSIKPDSARSKLRARTNTVLSFIQTSTRHQIKTRKSSLHLLLHSRKPLQDSLPIRIYLLRCKVGPRREFKAGLRIKVSPNK